MTQIIVFISLTLAIVVLYFFWNKSKLIDATECGHRTKIKDRATAFGQTITTEVPVRKDGTTAYCHKCLEKMAIRCAWCGLPIFVGEPITLYSPIGKDKNMPDYAIPYNKEHHSYVGCLRWDCAETGADRAGFWYPPGKVYRVPTAYEMIMHDVKEGRQLDSYYISDLSKP